MYSFNYYIDLSIELLKKELKVRYKSSFLGYFWSIAAPLLQAIIYYYAFKFIIKINIENYSVFLIVGLFPWQWFSNSIMSSIFAIIGNAQLIKKTAMPREILIVATVLNDTVHFILSIPVILIFTFLLDLKINLLCLLFLPLAIIIQLLTTLGIAFAVSAIGVYFRDIERLLVLFLNFLFYLTPIIYNVNMIPENFRKIVAILNPIFSIIELYRSLLIYGKLINQYWLISAIQSIIIFSIGFLIFKKLKWRFSELL